MIIGQVVKVCLIILKCYELKNEGFPYFNFSLEFTLFLFS